MKVDVEDNDLLERFKNGDENAFEILYTKYSRDIVRYINSYIKDTDVAEELMQEVFIILYKKPEKYDGKSKLISYIIGIARKKILVYFRNLKSHEAKINFYAKDLYDGDKSSRSILEILEQKEDSNEVKEILDNMNPTYSMAIKLVDFCELSYEQTANLMGKSLNQIKITVHRARKTLEKEMRRKHPDTAEKYSKGKRRDTLGFVLACIIGVSLLTGLVYATIKIYKSHIENKETFKLSEKENVIDESEAIIDKEHAKEIIDKYLKVLGCSGYDLDSIVLEKDPFYNMIFWKVENEEFRILIDASTGQINKYNYLKDFSNIEKVSDNIDVRNRIDSIYRSLNFNIDYKMSDFVSSSLESGLTVYQVTYSNDYNNNEIKENYNEVYLQYIKEIDLIKDIKVFNNYNLEHHMNITKDKAIEIIEDYYGKKESNYKIENIYLIDKPKENLKTFGDEYATNYKDYLINKNDVEKLWCIKLVKDGKDIVVYIDVNSGEIINEK